MSRPEPNRRGEASDTLAVEARTHRRTALIELCGELDIATAPQVAKMLDGVAPDADGVRHVIARAHPAKYVGNLSNQFTNAFQLDLNGSGTALARLFVALVESCQQADGSLVIPPALQPFFKADRIAA